MPVAGREHAAFADLVGYFANTLCLRLQVDERGGFAQHVEQVRAVLADALDRAETPFERIVDALDPERDLERAPLFQVMLNWVDEQHWQREAEGVAFSFQAEQLGSLVELTLYLRARENALFLELEYDTRRFDAAEIERKLEQLELLLADALVRPHAPLAELELLPRKQRRELLAWGQGPELPEDCVASVPRLFERSVETRGQASALLFGEEAWSYARLARRAHGVARGLQAAGVQHGQRVGIALPRGPELVAAQQEPLGRRSIEIAQPGARSSR